MKTTKQLVEETKAGYKNAFGELYTRHKDVVYNTARKLLGDSDDAQEICQDAFIVALEKIDQLSDPERFPGWLVVIARRLAIDKLKKRRAESLIDTANIATNGQTSYEIASLNEQKGLVKEAFDSLCEMDREILELSCIDDLTQTQISDMLGIPLGTVKSRLHKARQRLKERMT